MPDKKSSELVLVDWGNSSLRFFLVKDGEVRDQRIIPEGGTRRLQIFNDESLRKPATVDDPHDVEAQKYYRRKGAKYAEKMREYIGDWLDASPSAPVVMCGVIGSKEGWSVAPYLACPVDIPTLSSDLYKIPKAHLGVLKERDIYIISGLKDTHHSKPKYFEIDGEMVKIPVNMQHVMRSEETKAVGVYDLHPTKEDRLICMPGTHSQWTHMCGDEFQSFFAFRTGENFDYDSKVQTSSIASALPQQTQGPHLISFMTGLGITERGYGLSTSLLSVRAGIVTGDNLRIDQKSALSGVVIGHEVSDGLRIYGRNLPITLVINPETKADLYRRAFRFFGGTITQEVNADEVSLRGLMRIGSTILERPERPHGHVRRHNRFGAGPAPDADD
ncbi:MAG: 2-dehydro-3-deoxygalactonokinase [Pseudomonadota bacterium]|nr:2-dehydro-3-deoxygalactonokinase [Pseudomonadota bacterium]